MSHIVGFLSSLNEAKSAQELSLTITSGLTNQPSLMFNGDDPVTVAPFIL
jgi:hypothetical protein